jgi:hypothetical protein
VILCDIAGSAAPLVGAVETAIAQGFADPGLRDFLRVVPDAAAALALLAAGGF